MIPGFKEWTLVCDALGSGRQSIIIRKGGIAEGRAGFRFQHPEFLLFPTLFHEQAAKLKVPADTALPQPRSDGQHALTLRARVEWTHDLADLDRLAQLADFHIWQHSELEKRHHYGADEGKPGVSIACVRIERLSEPFVFPDSPKYGGCRSWVQLPPLPASTASQPVLGEKEHAARVAELRQILGI